MSFDKKKGNGCDIFEFARLRQWKKTSTFSRIPDFFNLMYLELIMFTEKATFELHIFIVAF